MPTLDTDYLVVGAGGAGMAFVDSLISRSDAEVVMVDRRHDPGGHWNDAYPFVRLHQPSANYGVNSRVLGTESIDTTGPNAGFYDRATGVEIAAYFREVLDGHLLPSGQVQFFGGCDYVGDWRGEHVFRSRLSGRTTTVRVRRKVVDGTYLETSVPATHARGFGADAEATVVPVGELAHLDDPPGGFTILGAGKTAMDACNWLLDNGVDPDRIRWVKPRDAWVFERRWLQPLDLVAWTMEGFARSVEALARAETVEDLLRRLEASGVLCRVDATVEPTMFRGATLSEGERAALSTIERVVRQGRVVHVGAEQIRLDAATVPTDGREVHVDCTAYGFRSTPSRAMFEPGRITIQTLMGGFTTFAAALVGYVEATREDDDEKNRLCPPTAPPSEPIDWIPIYQATLRSLAVHSSEPDVMAWLEESRLSLTRGMQKHMGDPDLQSAVARYLTDADAAVTNGDRLLGTPAVPTRS